MKQVSIAFTMAEILLSLTIIGVVAAITLPSLTGNINERTWNTQRKALFARMSQAISLLDSLRGYGNVNVASPPNDWDFGIFSVAGTTEAFLTAGLSRVMKLNNICNASNIHDCGMPYTVVDLVGSKVQLNSMHNYCDFHYGFESACANPILQGDLAAFETANGESVLAMYNPVCRDLLSAKRGDGGITTSSFYLSPITTMCVNFVYDLNGKKGPNIVNKDIGVMTVFYPTDPVVVAPVFAPKNASESASASSVGGICSAQGDDYRAPTKEELMSMHINYKFIAPELFSSGDWYSTSSCSDLYTDARRCTWKMSSLLSSSTSGTAKVRCVKR